MRRAGAHRRTISGKIDSQRLPRRHLRAGGRPGPGQEARRQIGGAARSRPSGDARHANRGFAPGAFARQHAGEPGPGGRRFCPGVRRHVGGKLPRGVGRAGRSGGRNRPACPERTAGARHASCRCGAGARAERAGRRADDASRGEVRFVGGQARAEKPLRSRGTGRLRRLFARRIVGGGRADCLSRTDAERQTSGAAAFAARGFARLHGHRRGDAAQSRIDRNALGRTARQFSVRDRPHGHGGRCAAHRGPAGRTTHRCEGHTSAPGCSRVLRRGWRSARGSARKTPRCARHRPCAGPSFGGARRTSRSCRLA